MSKPTPRILKFIHGKKSFFVSFNYITGVGIQGDYKLLGTFDKDTHIYTSAAEDTPSYQFHVNDDNDMCDDVYVLWCLLSEFIHTDNLSLEETGAEYNKIEMYIHNIGNIININLNLIILSARSGEEIKNVITDEIIDGKINSSNATFGDFKCNEIDLENIDSPNTAYGISHSKKMFMKKDDRGGGGGGDESGDDTDVNEYEGMVYNSARLKKQMQAQAQAQVLAQAQAREQEQAIAAGSVAARNAQEQAQVQAQVQAQARPESPAEDGPSNSASPPHSAMARNRFSKSKVHSNRKHYVEQAQAHERAIREGMINAEDGPSNSAFPPRSAWAARSDAIRSNIRSNIEGAEKKRRNEAKKEENRRERKRQEHHRKIRHEKRNRKEEAGKDPRAGDNPSPRIHRGQRGGRFVMVGGRKRYLRK